MDWRCRLSRAAATHALHGAGDGDGKLFDGDRKVRARNNADAIHLLDWMRDGDLRSSPPKQEQTNEARLLLLLTGWIHKTKLLQHNRRQNLSQKDIFFLKKKFGAGWTRDIIRSGSPPRSQIHHRKNLRLLVSISGWDGFAQNQAHMSGEGHMQL
jgi:hypothetical protein